MQWKEIPEFPEYSVSDRGQIMRNDTGRILVLSRNQLGIVNVGLTQGGTQYKRGVALIVANAFLPPPLPAFDTPIHLDGDQTNNAAYNLQWRPRWFAIKYRRQFRNCKPALKKTLIDNKTQVRYDDSWDAAISNGLLDKEVFLAVLNRTYVWPTYQTFRVEKS